MELIIYFYAGLLLVLLAYAANAFALAIIAMLRKGKPIKFEQLNELPFVTVQLPVYNEACVIERLLRSVAELDYPTNLIEVQLLDDSTDDTSEIAAQTIAELNTAGANIIHIRRNNRIGYKAGALAEATSNARGEFVAIFDADFVPQPSFLKELLPYFSSDDIAFVQARWEHMNTNANPLTAAEAIFLDGHFAVEQFARNQAGFCINFNGTAGIWRKSAISEAGGWLADTLTEDLDLSYRVQLNGKKGTFVREISVCAELPESVNAARAQQYRWTKGAVETALKILPRIATRKELSPTKMLQALFHLTANTVYPTILALVIINPFYNAVKFHSQNQVNEIMPVFGLGLTFTIVFYLTSQILLSRNIKKFCFRFPFALAISMGFAVSNTRAVLSALIGKKSEFVRTPKSNRDAGAKRYKMAKDKATITLELILSLYSLASCVLAVSNFDAGGAVFALLFAIGFGIVSIGSIAER